MAEIKKMDLVDIISASPDRLPDKVETSGIVRGLAKNVYNDDENYSICITQYVGLLQVPGQALFVKFSYHSSVQDEDKRYLLDCILATSDTANIPITIQAHVENKTKKATLFLAIIPKTPIQLGNILYNAKE